MKKILTLALCASLGFTAGAQGIYQFADPGFENWDADDEPGKGWTSFASADASALGGFIGNIAKSQSPRPSKVEGHNSATAVKIFSKSIIGANANGNLTTGQIHMGSATPTDASNYNSTKLGDAAHSLVFAGTPDAVSFYAKFKSGGSENGRGNFILHDECEYQDPEQEAQAANRVGKATALIQACSEWTYFEAPFVYDRTEKPATQYLLASFTTNPVPGGSANDELIIDDVHFIYYSTLATLGYDTYKLDLTSGTKDFDMSPLTYEAEKFSCTAKGAGATVETAFDEATHLLTITVKGNDYSVNSENVTVYRLQFAAGEPPIQAEPLGEKLLSLDQAAPDKTYVLYNEHYTAYAIFNGSITNTKLWAAEMKGGDAEHELFSSDYSRKLDPLDEGSSWMVFAKDGKYHLYNMGAKKYLTTENAEVPGVCGFSVAPVALTVVELGNGNFAFSATGESQKYMCASPQREAPICLWTSSDIGAAWQLKENPNVAADPSIFHTVTGIDAVTTAQPATGVYTLSGVKLNGKDNLPKGIYIVNGKKTVIGR